MGVYTIWLQNHLLAVITFGLTLILFYHYLIEKETGIRLSRRYRNSIFEAQSKVFLNATQYLISGHKDLAIREFLNAVDINRETIDTYFALGGLFRSNGEIEKAISIHRSLIARQNLSESNRLRALKELAVDFDKGGFVDKAIETYKDVLKINREQYEVIQSLCHIYEGIEDWDQAFQYRMALSKVGYENQAETISHILVQKAKLFFRKGDFAACREELDDAFRFAPSVSAKILKLKLFLGTGQIEASKQLLFELVKEHPMYTSFVFESLDEEFEGGQEDQKLLKTRYQLLRDFFLEMNDGELLSFPSVVLTRVRLLKQVGKNQDALKLMKKFMALHQGVSDVMRTEYIKLLLQEGETDEGVVQTQALLSNRQKEVTKNFCRNCGYDSDKIFWRCPQCYAWETIEFRWKV